MILVEIVFKCLTCRHMNQQEAGVDGYEQRQTEFNSFSDAVQHVVTNYQHEMVAETRTNEPD